MRNPTVRNPTVRNPTVRNPTVGRLDIHDLIVVGARRSYQLALEAPTGSCRDTGRRDSIVQAVAEAGKVVWYVAYGSNMSRGRLDCYLDGGTPSGARRNNPGARDPSRPRASAALTMPGQVYFAGHSDSWGGAMAFYDRAEPGTTLARAYLISTGQLSDVMAQEMGRPPGQGPALPLGGGNGRVELGPGRYETIVICGQRDGAQLVTFTAPWSMSEIELRRPTLPYLLTIATGLAQSHGLDATAQAAYLASLPGVHGFWEEALLAEAMAGEPRVREVR